MSMRVLVPPIGECLFWGVMPDEGAIDVEGSSTTSTVQTAAAVSAGGTCYALIIVYLQDLFIASIRCEASWQVVQCPFRQQSQF